VAGEAVKHYFSAVSRSGYPFDEMAIDPAERAMRYRRGAGVA
jgi:hypothetical protein